ncbi:DUF2516 family protein [Knoellia sp. 3-2P3]|jgi:hypothetical protein|uniref:DUF2516 family protein n=1 Tax=unclassified Knoellia TaxID=2618719 RepID=UPI0023DCBB8F|nr:DUF2516 family protein [Knoellia sp. 3-2P3]MDF2091652.1 DUF2516 family protein [Knoellia sp. 3-2P3]
MNFIGSAQSTVALLLGLAALALEVFAFVDALRHRPDAYVAAGKRTKQFWLIVTGVSALVGFVTFFSPLNLFGILAVVGAGIYLADVRPALQQVSGRGRGSSQGPYGPW